MDLIMAALLRRESYTAWKIVNAGGCRVFRNVDYMTETRQYFALQQENVRGRGHGDW
jgi:hypothetical protein